MNYLITAALPYINNVPHLGHIIGSHLPADIFYRYSKLRGHDCLFVGGSDEYGTPSLMASKKLGVSTQSLVDSLHPIHKRIYEWFEISYDNYSRTSTDFHSKNVHAFFLEVNERGFIREADLEMYYCEREDIFLADSFVVGTCPKCSYVSAGGDQCENCGYMVNVGDLINPNCAHCQGKADVRKSKHLFFQLSRFQKKLKEFINGKRGFWRDTVLDTTDKWLTEGLRDRCITRDLPWGVKVPLSGLESKVLYVWFDALLGYISFTKEFGDEVYRKFWENPQARVVHFLGKDNIPFHSVFWPAMLLAHEGVNLPYNIAGYQYLTFEGKKFSKSKGVGVFCYRLMDSGIDVEVLRSYLVQILPENNDANFRWDEFKTLVNSELIGKFGNFFNRTFSMVHRYFEGQFSLEHMNNLDAVENEFVERILTKIKTVEKLMDEISLRNAYRVIIELAADGNKFIDDKKPWELIKQGRRIEAQRSLFLAVNLAKTLAVLAYPFTPRSMKTIWTNQLGMTDDLEQNGWKWVSSMTSLPLDHRILQSFPVYKKIEDEDLVNFREKTSSDFDLMSLVVK